MKQDNLNILKKQKNIPRIKKQKVLPRKDNENLLKFQLMHQKKNNELRDTRIDCDSVYGREIYEEICIWKRQISLCLNDDNVRN